MFCSLLSAFQVGYPRCDPSTCLQTLPIFPHHVHAFFGDELAMLTLLRSWRFLFGGGTFEILFNILIGPSFLAVYFMCRKSKFIYCYLLVSILSLLVLHECYFVTGFRLTFPDSSGGFVYTPYLPLYFAPFYLQFTALTGLYFYLFYQSKDRYHLSETPIEIFKQISPYILFTGLYALAFLLVSEI